MQIQSEILRLHQTLNANVFPVPCGSKVPGRPWKAFSRKRLSADEIKALFAEQQEANIAIVCGRVSDLVVLDADTADALTLIRDNGVPVTPIAETARGKHYYFSANGKSFRTTKLCNGLDLRAEGSYVLAPPSIHPSGKVYEWIISPFEAEPATPPAWLLELIRSRSHTEDIVTIARGVHEGRRNISSAKLIGLLLACLPPNYWDVAWLLIKAWNQQNTPPEREQQLRYTFDCIAKKELHKRTKKQIETDRLKKIARIALENSGLSLRKLAILSNVSPSTLSRLLSIQQR